MKINTLIITDDPAELEHLTNLVCGTEISPTNFSIQQSAVSATIANPGDFHLIFLGKGCSPSQQALIAKAVDIPKANRPIIYQFDAIKGAISAKLACHHFSGTVAIQTADSHLVEVAHGHVDTTKKTANHTTTKFNIGSLAKLFTSLAIGKLIKGGRLDYDTPVVDLLKKAHCASKIINTFSREKLTGVTIHQLLSHTAGLDDRRGKIFEESLGPTMLTFRGMEEYVDHCDLEDVVSFEEHSAHKYSNLGYFLLGYVVEALTGDYYDYVRQQVLEPADMLDTIKERGSGHSFALPTLIPPPALPKLDFKSDGQSHALLAQIKKSKTLINKQLEVYQSALSNSSIDLAEFKAKFKENLELIYASIFPALHEQVKELNCKEIVKDALHQNIGWQLAMQNLFLNSLSISHSAGCWYSTARDLSKLMESVQRGSLADLREHLLQNPVETPSPDQKEKYAHGCVVYSEPGDSQYRFGHSGGVPGGLTEARAYPERQITLVILSNHENPGLFFEKILPEIEQQLVFGHENCLRYADVKDPDIKLRVRNDVAFLEQREEEKNNYIHRVQKILARTESGEVFTERDVLIIALGLKNISVFESHEDVRAQVLGNKVLLQLVMVTCGKVLTADPSNDALIDFLLERGIDINSADEKGMTATHYAAQNFYNYREEPLNLIKKLLDCGANIEVKDKQSRTPLMIIKERREDQRVSARDEVQKLLEQRRAVSTPAGASTTRALLETNLGFLESLPPLEGATHGTKNIFSRRF